MAETTIEVSVTIHRPIEEVFSFYIDVMNFSRWSEAIESVERSAEGEIKVGETFKVHIAVLGKRLEVDHEVVALERDRRFSYRVQWPLPCTWDVRFDPAPEGTKFSVTMKLAMTEGAGVFEKSPPMSFFQAKEHASMMTLKSILEQSTSSVR